MLPVVRRAACMKLSSAWRAWVTLRSAMLRISSGTWKAVCPVPVPWVPPAMVQPPRPYGFSEPVPADPGRLEAAEKKARPHRKDQVVPTEAEPPCTRLPGREAERALTHGLGIIFVQRST